MADVSYQNQVGETWMELFYEAYTGRPASIKLEHEITTHAIDVAKRILTPELVETPGPEPEPEPEPTGPAPFFGLATSSVVHDSHYTIRREREWPTLAAALADGRRPCRTCRPKEAA